MKKFTFAMFVTGIVLFSCKKSKDNDNGSQNQLLTASAWKYDTAMIDYDKNGTSDGSASSYIEACTKDNLITFKADSTGKLDEGATKCNSANPQTSSFKWWWKDQTTLTTPDPIFGGYSGDVKVTVLTSTKMEVIKEYNYGLGSANIIVDLKH